MTATLQVSTATPWGGGGGGGGGRLLHTCIGYTLGSQFISGIYTCMYPRWFLITHEGIISKPPRGFLGIHCYLGYKQFVG